MPAMQTPSATTNLTSTLFDLVGNAPAATSDSDGQTVGDFAAHGTSRSFNDLLSDALTPKTSAQDPLEESEHAQGAAFAISGTMLAPPVHSGSLIAKSPTDKTCPAADCGVRIEDTTGADASLNDDQQNDSVEPPAVSNATSDSTLPALDSAIAPEQVERITLGDQSVSAKAGRGVDVDPAADTSSPQTSDVTDARSARADKTIPVVPRKSPWRSQLDRPPEAVAAIAAVSLSTLTTPTADALTPDDESAEAAPSTLPQETTTRPIDVSVRQPGEPQHSHVGGNGQSATTDASGEAKSAVIKASATPLASADTPESNPPQALPDQVDSQEANETQQGAPESPSAAALAAGDVAIELPGQDAGLIHVAPTPADGPSVTSATDSRSGVRAPLNRASRTVGPALSRSGDDAAPVNKPAGSGAFEPEGPFTNGTPQTRSITPLAPEDDESQVDVLDAGNPIEFGDEVDGPALLDAAVDAGAQDGDSIETSVVQQVSEAVQAWGDSLQTQGAARFAAWLTPRGLGRVWVELKQTPDGITAQLSATDDGVQSILHAQESGLRQALEDSGITVTELSISDRAADDSASRQHQQSARRHDDPESSVPNHIPRANRHQAPVRTGAVDVRA